MLSDVIQIKTSTKGKTSHAFNKVLGRCVETHETCLGKKKGRRFACEDLWYKQRAGEDGRILVKIVKYIHKVEPKWENILGCFWHK